MIISKSILIKKPKGISCQYYKALGYDISLSELDIKIEDLSKSSKYLVNVTCDYCYNNKNIKFCDYNKITKENTEKYACKDCNRLKYKDNCMDKYGVTNTFQLESVKKSIKNTCIEKYGFEYHTQSTQTKNKIKESVLEKYGVENISQLKEIKDKVKKTNFDKFGSEFIFLSKEFRDKNYKIDSHEFHLSYINKSNHLFNCDNNKEHTFEINKDNFYTRDKNHNILCTTCNPIGENRSIKEKSLYDYIYSIDNRSINSYKDGLEIDIYIPELKIGFEFNGLHWHSSKYKDKNYHLDKTNYFKERGIRIIHIWEDDWDHKNLIIKSIIRNILYLTNNRIYARRCEVREISDIKEYKSFLDENHIQGSVNSSIKIGLYYDNKLVSLMTFDHFEGRKKMLDNEWNLNRFCNKINYNVTGGASKLLNYFISNYDVKRIVSYADKDWSSGALYEKLKFRKIYETDPDYKYYLIKENIRIHKSRFRKSKTNISEKIWKFQKYLIVAKSNMS